MEELKEIRVNALQNVRDIVTEYREEVTRAYRITTGLAYICRKEGLLALESAAELIPGDTPLCERIMEMVRLVVDGEDAQFISELLTNSFIVNQYCGLEAFLYYLYARSFLLIQSGTSPYQIESFFRSVMPEGTILLEEQRRMQSEHDAERLHELKACLSDGEKKRLSEASEWLHGMTEQEWKELVGSSGYCGFEVLLPFLDQKAQELTADHMNPYRYRGILESPRVVEEQELLEAVMELSERIADIREKNSRPCLLEDALKCSDKEIRNLLDKVEGSMLAIALKDTGTERERFREIRECFFRNMTLRERYCLQEDMEYMGPVRRRDVEEAQNAILQMIKGSSRI